MLYIAGTDGQYYQVVDTQKQLSKTCTADQIKEMVSQGIKIGGIKVNADGTSTILCHSPNFLQDFSKKIASTLAALSLLTKNADAKDKIAKVEQVAKDFGVLDVNDKLHIDLHAHTLLLPYQDMMIKYDERGNVDVVSKTEMLSVTDKNVAQYSKLGVDAFNYIYLEIDGKRYPLIDCVHLLQQVDNFFNPNNIKYIGITPSNRMFKFMESSWDIYSVKFGTVADLKKEWSKIRNRIAAQSTGFYRYAQQAANNPTIKTDELAIIKATKKNYNLDVQGLHSKYPTLHDVYFRM